MARFYGPLAETKPPAMREPPKHQPRMGIARIAAALTDIVAAPQAQALAQDVAPLTVGMDSTTDWEGLTYALLLVTERHELMIETDTLATVARQIARPGRI